MPRHSRHAGGKRGVRGRINHEKCLNGLRPGREPGATRRFRPVVPQGPLPPRQPAVLRARPRATERQPVRTLRADAAGARARPRGQRHLRGPPIRESRGPARRGRRGGARITQDRGGNNARAPTPCGGGGAPVGCLRGRPAQPVPPGLWGGLVCRWPGPSRNPRPIGGPIPPPHAGGGHPLANAPPGAAARGPPAGLLSGVDDPRPRPGTGRWRHRRVGGQRPGTHASRPHPRGPAVRAPANAPPR